MRKLIATAFIIVALGCNGAPDPNGRTTKPSPAPAATPAPPSSLECTCVNHSPDVILIQGIYTPGGLVAGGLSINPGDSLTISCGTNPAQVVIQARNAVTGNYYSIVTLIRGVDYASGATSTGVTFS